MLKTTAGQAIVNAGLPLELRDYTRRLDKRGVQALLQRVAETQPERYKDIAQHLLRVGQDAAYYSGGFTFGLDDLRPTTAALTARQRLQAQADAIYAANLPPAAKAAQLIALLGSQQKPLEDAVMAEATATNNPFARQVLSGARGSAANLKSLIGFDGMYVDHRNRPLPVPVLHSYSEGLTPIEYWAGTFGARKGVVDTKLATQRSGFLAKQFNQAVHRLLVTAVDDPDDDGQNVNHIGLPVDTDDEDNVGALLAYPVGGYGRNTPLTAKIISDLTERGFKRILVRSPLTGGPPQGGVYARDVGFRERGGLPPRGDYVGLAAAQALSERLTQGMLGSKHLGGVAGRDGTVTGFPLINQLVQVPKVFKGGAAHAQADGVVGHIREAPQGGHYVTIDGQQHYVDPESRVLVKPGDVVEAGDVLSTGIPNPAEVVRHKGIGEGRSYFTRTLRQAFSDSGAKANRRNIELLAAGLLNHVQLTAEHGPYVPDDIVPYNLLLRDWQPREGSRELAAHEAAGKYLEQPALHYSVGTKLRPSVLKSLAEFGVKRVTVHDEPPPFEPLMLRAMTQLQYDPDVLARHLGSGLEKATLSGVHRGAVSEPGGTSFASAVVFDPLRFGRQGLTQGWRPPAADRR